MRQLKLFAVFILVIMLFGCGTVNIIKSSNFDKNKYKNVTVLYFEAVASTENDKNIKTNNATFGQIFVPHLMAAGFDVVDRSGIEKIMKEQNLNATGVVNNDTLKQIGKVEGVDAIVMGSFEYTITADKNVVKNIRGSSNTGTDVRVYKSGEYTLIYKSISIRFVDVETGEVVLSATYENAINGKDLDGVFSQIATVIKEAINK